MPDSYQIFLQCPSKTTYETLDRTAHGGEGERTMSQIASSMADGDSKEVIIARSLTVKELANKLGVPDTIVIKTLFMTGIMRTVHQLVELDYAKDTARKLGFTVIEQDSCQ